MENAGYLFASFTIIWALVFGYVLYLNNKQKNLKREIDLLKKVREDENTESAINS